jgi:hypothetical protein
MAVFEKKEASETEGSGNQEENQESVLARRFVSIMIDVDRVQDAKRRVFAIEALDVFLSDIEGCNAVDEFDIILRRHTLEWSQVNYFVEPEKDILGDMRGWNIFVKTFWESQPAVFAKTPHFKDGKLLTYFASVNQNDDTPILKNLLDTAVLIVKERRSAIISAEPPTWSMCVWNRFVLIISQLRTPNDAIHQCTPGQSIWVFMSYSPALGYLVATCQIQHAFQWLCPKLQK